MKFTIHWTNGDQQTFTTDEEQGKNLCKLIAGSGAKSTEFICPEGPYYVFWEHVRLLDIEK